MSSSRVEQLLQISEGSSLNVSKFEFLLFSEEDSDASENDKSVGDDSYGVEF